MKIRPDHSTSMPDYRWWAALGMLIVVGLLGNWLAAAGFLILFLTWTARPFDFMVCFLLVTAGAAFVRYEAGQQSMELGLLTVLILVMLFSYALSSRGRLLAFSKTTLLVPLFVYSGLTLANYFRGLYVGNAPKDATLELLPALALASGLLVANVFDPRRDLRFATWSLLAIGYGSASLGYYFFSVYHVRTGGVYFMPIPGMIAMVPVNLALRSTNPKSILAWCLLSLPLFIHQFISYTRGYWLGCIAGLLVSFITYARWGEGARLRWRRTGVVFGTLVGVGLAGAVTLSLALDKTDFLSLAASRFKSITGTKLTHDTASNVDRLLEYADVIPRILAAPWFGHGVGYAFNHRDPLTFKTSKQWWVHELYLFLLLKQGLVGLLALVWMLWSATVLGIRESVRNRNAWESAWLAAAAASTIFQAVLGLTNFNLIQVNSSFVLALLWGGAMAIGRQGFIRFRWTDVPGPPHPPGRSS